MPGLDDDYRLGRAVITAALSAPDLLNKIINEATEVERKFAIGYLAAALVAIWEEILEDPVQTWSELLMIEAMESLEEDNDDRD